MRPPWTVGVLLLFRHDRLSGGGQQVALKSAEWATEVAARVGKRVQHFREKGPGGSGKKVSVQVIADRCAELGLPLDRAVIAKLEKGLRQTVTIGELMVFAEALGVPPVLLLFPLGEEESVEVLPGRLTDTWSALKWFSGQGDASADHRQSDLPTQLWEAHEVATVTWFEAADYMIKQQSFGVPPADAHRNLLATRRLQEDSLRAIRGRIRALELKPPALPAELSHLEEGQEEQDPEDGE